MPDSTRNPQDRNTPTKQQVTQGEREAADRAQRNLVASTQADSDQQTKSHPERTDVSKAPVQREAENDTQRANTGDPNQSIDDLELTKKEEQRLAENRPVDTGQTTAIDNRPQDVIEEEQKRATDLPDRQDLAKGIDTFTVEVTKSLVDNDYYCVECGATFREDDRIGLREVSGPINKDRAHTHTLNGIQH